MTSELEQRYPKTFATTDGDDVTIRLMTAADADGVMRCAERQSQHDLLFLQRDITQPGVMQAWVNALGSTITSLVAERDGEIVGCTAVVTDPYSFSPHVGELRVLLDSEQRETGVGRALVQENFIVALSLGLAKLTAHMTVDQRGAIRVFEDLDFSLEARLKGHVEDREGNRFDLVILSHDVAAVQAKLALYGLDQEILG